MVEYSSKVLYSKRQVYQLGDLCLLFVALSVSLWQHLYSCPAGAIIRPGEGGVKQRLGTVGY